MIFSRLRQFLYTILPARSSTVAQMRSELRALREVLANEHAERNLIRAHMQKDEAVHSALRSWVSAVEVAQAEANSAWLLEHDKFEKRVSQIVDGLSNVRSDLTADETALSDLGLRTSAAEQATATAMQCATVVETELRKLGARTSATDIALEKAEKQLTATERSLAELSVQVNESAVYSKWLKETHSRLSVLEGRVAEFLAGASASQWKSDSETHDWFDGFYLEFENRYRGTRESVSDRQAFYLPLIMELTEKWGTRPNDIPIIDLGCGRGEWLELLNSKGFTKSKGVDSNQSMLKSCTERNLHVVEGDALSFIRGQPEGSLAVISAMHIAEHLPFFALVDLLAAAKRALRKDGILIVETPNCENVLVATRGFHMDPTHRAPLPPLLLSFLVEYVGFQEVKTIRLHPYPEDRRGKNDGTTSAEITDFFFGPQDYAIIASAP